MNVLTPEQRCVLDFMDRRGLISLSYYVRDEYEVIITRADFVTSKPLAEIFAIKVKLYESGDAEQEFQVK